MPVVVSASEAVLSIQPGKRIFLGSGSSVPLPLVKALYEHGSHFRDNQVFNIFTLGKADYVCEELKDNLRSTNFFIGENVRKSVQEGIADYIPIFLSEIPGLIRSPSFDLDTALISVTPPDKHGMCSLGVSVDIVRASVDSAKRIIAVINPQMPRTFGQSFVPYSRLDMVVHADYPIPELDPGAIDEVNSRIGENIAELIEDGSVLQMGIGAIPDAVLKSISHKRNLGVHTEMFSDGLIPLIESGVITNQTKKILKGRTMTSFVRGSKRLYDFVHENPLVEFYPSDYANDPFIISQNDKVVAINSALQVDLTGQICADSIGKKFYSGIGGQVDFMRGAARSKGGKPIIALPATAKDGTISRIVPELFSGAGVVTSRGDAHYIVTEFGVAYLHGKSIRERAVELISIAHPDFRKELLDFVKQTKYVYFNQQVLNPEFSYPKQMESQITVQDKTLRVRPLKPADERLLQDFFYSHNLHTIQNRYLGSIKSMPQEKAQNMVNLDYKNTMALAVFDPGDFSAKIIGVARYHAHKGEDICEMSVVVAENYRKQGLARELVKRLTEYARSMGYKKVRSFAASENIGIRRLLQSVCPDDSAFSITPSADGCEILIDFSGGNQ
ncbi:MAG: GNAT family N-acetyltransferase [Candidatus Cloacimonetes bacterium]|nr:GNAT family N-acetyltransferase [Candidatus Cloacimonadota bacterium]